MNTELLKQNADYWKASKVCRDEFIKAMEGRHYGAEETLDAWLWFFNGWKCSIRRLLREVE